MKSIAVMLVFYCFSVPAVQAATAHDDGEFRELLTIFTRNRQIYDACYMLASEQVLTDRLRKEIVEDAADREKGVACSLAITSKAVRIRVIDEASLRALQAHFTNQKWCAAAKADLMNARSAVEMYYLDNARYPSTLQELAPSPSFQSAMEYRLDDNRQQYHLSAENKGCGRIFSFDSSDATVKEKPPARE